MEQRRPLAPCLVGRGSLSSFRDMLRALETIETLEYRYLVDGSVIDEGRAALVKLMADPDSSTIVVNGCLFLNVASFRYLDFEAAGEDRWRFMLRGDETLLELVSLPEEDGNGEDVESRRPHLLMTEEMQDFESLILLDDEDDED
ncbi:MAG: hypothetical protein U1E26_09400 [Coriobacteriia bacterium]|nr:hypothetical protein [Coriobacteriia bacterium]